MAHFQEITVLTLVLSARAIDLLSEVKKSQLHSQVNIYVLLFVLEVLSMIGDWRVRKIVCFNENIIQDINHIKLFYRLYDRGFRCVRFKSRKN